MIRDKRKNNIQTKKFPAIGNFFAEILFPSICYSCKKSGSYLCEECFERISTLPHPVCPHCSVALPNGILPMACKNILGIQKLYVCADYKNEIIQKLIKDIKYRRAYKLTEHLASFAYWWMNSKGYLKELQRKNTLLVAVPSHKKKEKQRGFNHAEKITSKISELANIPHNNNVLVKNKNTRAQVETLSREERLKNVKGVYGVKNKKALLGKTIILVDDVITTGSTMRECAKTLRRAGASEVWGLAIAKD